MKYQKLDGRNEISVMFWKFVCSSCTGCRQPRRPRPSRRTRSRTSVTANGGSMAAIVTAAEQYNVALCRWQTNDVTYNGWHSRLTNKNTTKTAKTTQRPQPQQARTTVLYVLYVGGVA